MKKIKLVLWVALIVFTIVNLSVSIYSDIVITSQGRTETTIREDGTIVSECNNKTVEKCSISMKPRVD